MTSKASAVYIAASPDVYFWPFVPSVDSGRADPRRQPGALGRTQVVNASRLHRLSVGVMSSGVAAADECLDVPAACARAEGRPSGIVGVTWRRDAAERRGRDDVLVRLSGLRDSCRAKSATARPADAIDTMARWLNSIAALLILLMLYADDALLPR